ncbi:hypothetical protein [Paenibacillus sp. sgz500958]|uniref:hypothetical protein n=1 Tax=Paenibacillus sp. sgz500958 TaxID=3242475 RepID=UPI0036D4200B
MKLFIALLLFISLAGCSSIQSGDSPQASDISQTSATPQTSASLQTSASTQNSTATPQVTNNPQETLMTEDEAVELIKSKLTNEDLRVSSVRSRGLDKNGNYTITQSFSATTEVMEWFHVNPRTREITCDFMSGMCFANQVESTRAPLTPEQEQAQALARDYAKRHFADLEYVDGITFVSLSHEDQGKLVFQVYNVGSGRSKTIDWLTVDLTARTVTPMLIKETQIDKDDFAIMINENIVPLHGWDNEIDLISLLGEPLSQHTTTLQNADTLTGSYLKEIKYPGLEMELFSPKGNGKTFWIMSMKLTDSTQTTVKGLRVGMNLDDLKSAYRDIPIAPDGRTDPDNCAYRISIPEKYDYARYEVKHGVIHEIYIYNEIP